MTAGDPFYARNGLNVESYDSPDQGVADVLAGDIEFYIDYARRSGGAILDLGGGTGRVAWPLAEAGFEVTSLDLSPPMLAVSEKKRAVASPAAQPRITLVNADVRDFALSTRFGLAIAPGRTFQLLLTPEDQRVALATVHRHLRPGGVLILELFDPSLEACAPFDGVPPNSDRGVVALPGSGHRVTRRVVHRTIDSLRQLMTEVWEFTELDAEGHALRTEQETLQMRWTYRFECATCSRSPASMSRRSTRISAAARQSTALSRSGSRGGTRGGDGRVAATVRGPRNGAGRQRSLMRCLRPA
jgi:ubiquinone/menaquinone biosynthesis C-methylase UbiE